MTVTRARVLAAGLAAALCLVIAHEGYVASRYLDPVGIPTACFGHTANVEAGKTYTRPECMSLLYGDLITANEAIDSCIHVPLTDNQRSAFVSMAYNVGGSAFCRSTLVRKLNQGDYSGACDEISRWVYARGYKEPLPGLVKRRAAERELCRAA